jgi:signal transduction histidine kinase
MGEPMSLVGAVNIVVAVIELLIVALIIREGRTFGRGAPPVLWAIAAFFVADALVAVNRSEIFWDVSGRFYKATILDVIALSALVFIFIHIRSLTRAAVATLDLAEYKAVEYERARRDYTQVVRHRVMNPVTVIIGAGETLRAGAIDDPELSIRLIGAIVDSARAIENETLAPERRDDLERELDPVPRIEEVP